MQKRILAISGQRSKQNGLSRPVNPYCGGCLRRFIKVLRSSTPRINSRMKANFTYPRRRIEGKQSQPSCEPLLQYLAAEIHCNERIMYKHALTLAEQQNLPIPDVYLEQNAPRVVRTLVMVLGCGDPSKLTTLI